MHIVIGLGNPGREYTGTRHNVGFMVIDELAGRLAVNGFRRRFRSELGEGTLAGDKVVLVKPQTYMNLSGAAVREVVNWYHSPKDVILVVLDDLDLPFGSLRLRAAGSAGGHNGLSSVIEHLGSNQVPRLKVGIGRGRLAPTAHVLARFSPEEQRDLPNVVDRAADAVEHWAQQGIIAAMNRFNGAGD